LYAFVMADYRIICTRKSTPTPAGHQHIVQVGVGTQPSAYTQLINVSAVYQAMDKGDRFYTQSVSTGDIALVSRWHCCGIDTLRSAADAVADNNLDNLPSCG
jgi:hypothetical protein